jgi:hypothetical protein
MALAVHRVALVMGEPSSCSKDKLADGGGGVNGTVYPSREVERICEQSESPVTRSPGGANGGTARRSPLLT